MFKPLSLALTVSMIAIAANAAVLPAPAETAPVPEETPSNGIQCSQDASAVDDLIGKQETCYMAAKIARECAWGSNVDVGLVATAQKICLKNMKKWPRRHKVMRAQLYNDCDAKYKNEEGSLARASHAHCYLNIDELFSGLNDEPLN